MVDFPDFLNLDFLLPEHPFQFCLGEAGHPAHTHPVLPFRLAFDVTYHLVLPIRWKLFEQEIKFLPLALVFHPAGGQLKLLLELPPRFCLQVPVSHPKLHVSPGVPRLPRNVLAKSFLHDSEKFINLQPGFIFQQSFELYHGGWIQAGSQNCENLGVLQSRLGAFQQVEVLPPRAAKFGKMLGSTQEKWLVCRHHQLS